MCVVCVVCVYTDFRHTQVFSTQFWGDFTWIRFTAGHNMAVLITVVRECQM